MAFATLFSGFAAASAWAAPVYKSADFSGGLFSVTSSMKNKITAAGFDQTLFNCSTCFNATSVTGHVIYDSSLAVPGSGTVNVFSIGAIPNVANSLIFDLDIDGISLDFGDPGVLGGPAVQYKNGTYNGFFFAESFSSPNQTGLQFNLQGGSFSLKNSNNQTLFTGFLTVGANGLTNVQDFNPTGPQLPEAKVPAPGTLALLAVAFISSFALRRRKPFALACSARK